MIYLGDFAEDATVYIPFNTFDSNDPAASATITNLAATDVHIHKDGSATQKTTSNGVTVSIDFDTVTGNHIITLDTSNDTGDAGFWVAGAEYSVRIEGTTVDAGTVNAWIAHFSIERSGGVLALIKAGNISANVTQISGDSTAADNLELDYDGTGYNKSNSTIGTCTTNTDMITTAQVNAEVDTALADIHLDHLLAVASPASFAAGSILQDLLEDNAGTWRFTAASLVNAPDTITGLTVDTVNDKTGYSLTQSFPTNFSDLAITVTTGQVTVGTNNDKSGYSISGTKTTLDALNDIAATDIVSGGAITTSGGRAESNVKYVNDVAVTGVGTEADPWGP